MNLFDLAAVLMAVAAVCGFVNYRWLRLPATSGTLVVALATSIAIVAINVVVPGLGLQRHLADFMSRIDFNEAFMHGMLAFLLFAGALSVDLGEMAAHRWTVGILATASVILSTAVVGALTWGVFTMLGTPARLEWCLVFGALISPTDPIAVIGLLKEVKAPPSLEAQIAGESLFNDGIGVVVFLALTAVAGLDASADGVHLEPSGAALFFLRQVIGGAAVGLTFGYLAYEGLKRVEDPPLELLITLAIVMFTYSVSFWIHASGPIAVVVAGLLIGSMGRRRAMTTHSREHIDAFWHMLDEVLNAVLFLLLGLQVALVAWEWRLALASVLILPVVLVARFVSVLLPSMVQFRRGQRRGWVQILTWAGLRGGLSVAMMLSLPPFPARDTFLACTYAVVVFSILGQGLTTRRMLAHYGWSGPDR